MDINYFLVPGNRGYNCHKTVEIFQSRLVWISVDLYESKRNSVF